MPPRLDRRSLRSVQLRFVLALSAVLVLAAAAPSGADPQSHLCPTANCTSNDLEVLSLQAIAFAGNGNGTCTGPADTIDIKVTHVLDTQGGSTKYDVGIYVNNDGGGLTTCWVDILEATNSTGASDLGEQDACLDLDGDDQVTHAVVVNIPCVDVLPPFGELDPVTVWESWANNDDEVVACTHANVIEGTEAKCAVQLAVPGVNVPGSCGDGEVSGGEQCDDGNNVDGDGCSAQCISEVPTVGEWGLGALGVLLLAAGALAVRRGGLI